MGDSLWMCADLSGGCLALAIELNYAQLSLIQINGGGSSGPRYKSRVRGGKWFAASAAELLI
jgi:hypothetical protein